MLGLNLGGHDEHDYKQPHFWQNQGYMGGLNSDNELASLGHKEVNTFWGYQQQQEGSTWMGNPTQLWLNCRFLWVQLQPLLQLQKSSFLPLKHLLPHQTLRKQHTQNAPAGFQVRKMYLYQICPSPSCLNWAVSCLRWAASSNKI